MYLLYIYIKVYIVAHMYTYRKTFTEPFIIQVPYIYIILINMIIPCSVKLHALLFFSVRSIWTFLMKSCPLLHRQCKTLSGNILGQLL